MVRTIIAEWSKQMEGVNELYVMIGTCFDFSNLVYNVKTTFGMSGLIGKCFGKQKNKEKVARQLVIAAVVR